ncbi:MAG: ABC transporter substrate-binding protein [Acetobacteraceae bacterium]
MPSAAPRLMLAALGLCAALAAAPPARAATGDSPGDPLVVAYEGGAVTLDPIMRSETTTYAWQRNIFDTITILDAEGNLQPRIALAWKNLDPTTWRLTLRQGVTFQNGAPMTAEDVGQSIMDTARNPKSQTREFVDDVSGFKVVDAHTIDVSFSKPDPIFPLHLAQVPVMPEALIKKEGREAFANHPIGTGPYKFVSWLADDHLDLTAWHGFWGSQPAFHYVKLESIPNSATRLAALLSGQVQVAEKIDPSDFARVRSSGRAYITTTPGERTIYLTMDDWRKTGSPGLPKGATNPFLDPRVREAVRMALDVDLIRRKIFNGAAKVAAQFLPPGIEGHNPDAKPVPFDVAGARKLLTEAGYPHGFTVRLDATNDRYLQDSLVAQAIGGLLQAAGITVQVNAIPKAVFFPAVNKGAFTMYMAGWGNLDGISTWNSMFHCRDLKAGLGHVNRAHYCDPAADAVMAKASVDFDDAARVKLIQQAYHTAERTDFGYLPLYFEDVIAGVANTVGYTSRKDEEILAWQMTRKK